MNKIEITVLSARVLDALSGRGLKAKTVHEFEMYGTRRIVNHCLGKGQILYSKETVQNFVWQERAKQESGTLPRYQWGITRRAAVYLDQMAEYGKIQDEPIRPWEAEHNPLFQAISCNPSNSMKVIDIICRTRDAVMQLELSDKTKTNYIYCGFGAILNFFISRGEESYSPETLALFVKTVQENFVNGAIQKASFQTMRKAAHWIEEYLSTGQVSQQKLRKYNFACAPPEFENLLSQYQLYMDNENYLKEGSRQFYLSSVRTFFRTIATLGIYRYAEITLPDVTRCLAKIAIQADVERIRYRKPPPALVGYLTKEELSIFLAQPNCKKRTGFRNMVFLVLMYDTAARCQEMLDLRIQDLVLHRTSPCVYFTGKGNKTRVVPILPKTAEHLRSYLKKFHPAENRKRDDYVFYAYGGPQRPMSPDTVAAFVKKYGESARHVCTSIPERVHPHMLRHTRAMHLYQDGVPLAMVSEFLGHAQIETTKIYAHADTEMKRKAIQQAANKLNDTIPDALWNTDDEEMMLKLRGKQQYK